MEEPAEPVVPDGFGICVDGFGQRPQWAAVPWAVPGWVLVAELRGNPPRWFTLRQRDLNAVAKFTARPSPVGLALARHHRHTEDTSGELSVPGVHEIHRQKREPPGGGGLDISGANSARLPDYRVGGTERCRWRAPRSRPA